MAKHLFKIASFLTMSQLDELSSAEIDYIDKKGLHNLQTEYLNFLNRINARDFWSSLMARYGNSLPWCPAPHFKTWITIRLILDGADVSLTDFYFKEHIKEYASWHCSHTGAAQAPPSTIARLISYFIDSID